MRPERRKWGPSVDVGSAEVVADIFRGLEELSGAASVSVAYVGHDYDKWSMTISVLGWQAFSHWLAGEGRDTTRVVQQLSEQGWLNTAAEHREAAQLLGALHSHLDIWSEFVDPDEPDLIELVVDL